MALDATVGGAAANSYVTQAAATTYFTDRLNAATLALWTAASTGDKDSYLIAATRRLDTEPYIGAVVYIDQALKWPRYAAWDDEDRLLSSTSIPAVIQRATFELAFAVLGTPTLLDDSGLMQFENVKVGTLDVTPRAVQAAPLPDFVRRLIRGVRLGGMGATVTRA